MKLAVGVRDVTHLRELQAARMANGEALRHRTRNFPRRAQEIIDGGSMYWVVAGSLLVRQRVIDIVPATWEDGSACAAIMLDSVLVGLAGRPTRAFQGWRYLEPAGAPADFGDVAVASGVEDLPEAMRAELRELGLL